MSFRWSGRGSGMTQGTDRSQTSHPKSSRDHSVSQRPETTSSYNTSKNYTVFICSVLIDILFSHLFLFVFVHFCL